MDFVLCALSHGVQHTDLTSLSIDNIQSMVIYLSNEALLRKHVIFLNRQKNISTQYFSKRRQNDYREFSMAHS